ncbi:dihydroxyacetone kinase subunit DhaL [Allostreptomyces psammosilenae]|uniref:dihydroxyacetone kinase subunit DhaL n=1 Tax=Allostreptomyces psammosilenae TaxID=1892865 RepID=UPI0015C854DC|nr:dihydroxyacetone kinase subunit DhaL [Allostreptomyces psammosilenae]
MLDAELFRRWLVAAAEAVSREAKALTDLDAAIGDADHGANLDRGYAAVRARLTDGSAPAPATPGEVLVTAGRQLVATVGGASGPLLGTALRRAGRALGDAERVDGARLGEALRAATTGVREMGGAAPGDKTMVDALQPAADAYDEEFARSSSLLAAVRAAATAARRGAEATGPLRARKGRASYLGERSAGHLDPGAVSVALLVEALAAVCERAAGRV